MAACGAMFGDATGRASRCSLPAGHPGSHLDEVTAGLMPDPDDLPVHQPAAPDAPIPGRHWYSGCDPDRPRVRPDGVCSGCGEQACPDCGHEVYPDGVCGCPDSEHEPDFEAMAEARHGYDEYGRFEPWT